MPKEPKSAVFSAEVLKIVGDCRVPLVDALQIDELAMTRIEALLFVKAIKAAGFPKTQAYYRLKRFVNEAT